MLKRMNINWNARQLVKMCMNGSITFDNAIQRGYVWDVKRKSLLIESMIIGYPVPAFYARRDEKKVFDMLDGKQRSSAIYGYLNNEYALEGVSEEYEGKYPKGHTPNHQCAGYVDDAFRKFFAKLLRKKVGQYIQ